MFTFNYMPTDSDDAIREFAHSGERLSVKAQTTLFLVLVLLGAAPLNTALINIGDFREPAAMPLTLGLMWMPAMAALAVRLISAGSVKGLGWRLGKIRFLAIAYVVTLVIASGPYAIALLTNNGTLTFEWWPTAAGNWGLPSTPVLGLFMLLTVNVIFAMIAALGEELGWRGFLVPALSSYLGFWIMVLITWAVTLLFHIPAILGAGYNGSGTPAWFSVVSFSLLLLPLCTFMAWLRLSSASIWPCVLAHAAHNVAIQEIWASGIVPNEFTPWLVGEFGALTPLIAIIVVAAILTRELRDPTRFAPRPSHFLSDPVLRASRNQPVEE